MSHDWKASKERLAATLKGETPDRVPFALWALEDMGARITGLTVREMLLSPKQLADASIRTFEFLGTDVVVPLVAAYSGPLEGVAFAKANRRPDAFVWKDYSTPFIHEGKLCESERDVENLEIPDHLKVEPWPTILKAMAIIKEKTGMNQSFIPSLTWSNIQMLRGSRAYLDVIECPELLLMLCEKIYASQLDYYDAFCKIYGKPSIVFNCQYAFNRHMLSFEDAWKFEGQFVTRFCKQVGLPLAIHNCGFEPYWDEVIERHNQEGVRVLLVNGSHPLDLDEWVRFRHKFPEIVIEGASIYVNAELLNGSPADVEERVRQNIVKLAPFSKFIVNPVCNLGWRMHIDNVLAVRSAVEKYGRYPISVAV